MSNGRTWSIGVNVKVTCMVQQSQETPEQDLMDHQRSDGCSVTVEV